MSRSRRPQRARVDTSWEAVAGWYDGWMGEQGDGHHRHNLIPHLLDLLQLQPAERFLDIGCGQGVLAPHIAAAGASYVGVDLSPRLIELARRRHGRLGDFFVADARRLSATGRLAAASFDAAAFLVSIQDMEPLAAVLQSLAWAMRPRGRIALLLPHPAFQVPRQSGWGWDLGRKLRYRRVDS